MTDEVKILLPPSVPYILRRRATNVQAAGGKPSWAAWREVSRTYREYKAQELLAYALELDRNPAIEYALFSGTFGNEMLPGGRVRGDGYERGVYIMKRQVAYRYYGWYPWLPISYHTYLADALEHCRLAETNVGSSTVRHAVFKGGKIVSPKRNGRKKL
jgi:hypothetical protein